jgi:hypothetical protein
MHVACLACGDVDILEHLINANSHWNTLGQADARINAADLRQAFRLGSGMGVVNLVTCELVIWTSHQHCTYVARRPKFAQLRFLELASSSKGHRISYTYLSLSCVGIVAGSPINTRYPSGDRRCMVHFKGLSQLKVLTLDHTQVTDDGVAKLEEALPNCQISH